MTGVFYSSRVKKYTLITTKLLNEIQDNIFVILVLLYLPTPIAQSDVEAATRIFGFSSVSSTFYVCNVGNGPLFVTRNLNEVIDITFCSEAVLRFINNWHV